MCLVPQRIIPGIAVVFVYDVPTVQTYWYIKIKSAPLV